MSTSTHSNGHQLWNQSSLINHKLPVEILLIIILFIGPSTFENPYVYLLPSWVCRYWRTIVVDSPIFWNVVKGHDHFKSPEFLQATICRSQSSKLDIFWCACMARCLPSVYNLGSRIRTLCLREHRHMYNFLECGLRNWPKFSFPQLESLIFPYDFTFDPSSSINTKRQCVFNLLTASRLRYLEIPASLLVNLNDEQTYHMPNLSHLEWLKVTSIIQTGFPLHKFLPKLPNLRILNLHANYPYLDTGATITLPNLRMLSLNGFSSCSIQAPTLEYIGISDYEYPQDDILKTDVSEYLRNINLPMLKDILVRLDNRYGYFQGCISTGHSEHDNCQSSHDFHRKISLHSALERHLLLPPKHSFHVDILWSTNFKRLFLHLSPATNIVELTVVFGSDQSYQAHHKEGYQRFFTELLTSLKAVVHLTALHCGNFVSLCKFLKQGRSLPSLERLTYHSAISLANPSFMSKHLKSMQETRVKMSCEPLKILELKNFKITFPKTCRQIEQIGIQLIQPSL